MNGVLMHVQGDQDHVLAQQCHVLGLRILPLKLNSFVIHSMKQNNEINSIKFHQLSNYATLGNDE